MIIAEVQITSLQSEQDMGKQVIQECGVRGVKSL